jgi:hypothetical protein
MTIALPAAESALTVPISAERTRELAALIDTATDIAARSAQDAVTAVTTAISQAASWPALPPAPPDNPYSAALDKAMAKFGGYPGQPLAYRRIQAAQAMLDELAAKGITPGSRSRRTQLEPRFLCGDGHPDRGRKRMGRHAGRTSPSAPA